MRWIIQKYFLFSLILICKNAYTQSNIQYDHINWTEIPVSGKQINIPTATAWNEGTLIALNSGRLIIAGGKKEVGGKKYFNDDIFQYEYQNGHFVVQSNSSSSLKYKVAFAGVFSDDSGIYSIGGENDAGILATAFLLKWDVFKNDFIYHELPSIPKPLKSPAIIVTGDRIYITGGESESGYNQDLYCLDLNALPLSWVRLASLPKTLKDVTLFVQSNGWGQTLFAGGQPMNDHTGELFAYNTAENQWALYSAFPEMSSRVIPTGSTFALIAPQSHSQNGRDSLLLYNTITKQIVSIGKFPSSGISGKILLEYNDSIWLLDSDEKGLLQVWKGAFNTYTYFSTWDYLVIVVYLVFSVFIGLFMAGKQKSTANYFKGGGKIPGWAVGISILATNLSAITFMSVPAKTYATNWNYFFMMISVLFVIPVINRYFIPFYRKLNITSAYEYLDLRFSYSVRLIASLLYILLEVGRISIILILPSIALSVVTGIDVTWCILLMGLVTVFYTFKGGIKAVIWTDVFQVFILLGGALVCLMYIPFQLPVSGKEMIANVIDNQKFNLLDTRIGLSSPNFLVVLIGGFVLNFLSFATDQTTVQRYLTTKDENTTKKSVRIGVWLTLPAGFIFFSIGTLLYLFYYYYPGKVNISLQSQDSIFPWYLVTQLPTGVLGLLIAAIFAAAMSALSSSLNSLSTAFITDFYKIFYAGRLDKRYLLIAKITTLLIGLASTGIALFIAKSGIVSLWDQFNAIVGLFTGGIGGIFLLGIFTTRANTAGALGGLVVGGICQYLISRYTSVNFLLYAFTGLSICFLSGLLISYCFPASTKDISGLTVRSKNNI